MNINDLDNDSLRLVLELCGFTVPQLIHLRIVSPKWKIVIEKMCASKKSLKLIPHVKINDYDRAQVFRFDDNFDVGHYTLNVSRDNTLWLNACYPAICEMLLDLFPNLEKLFIYCYQTHECFSLENLDIPFLLKNMSKLKSVAFFKGPDRPELIQRIFDSISCSTSIKSLFILDVPNLNRTPLPKWKAALPNLEHFCLHEYQNCDDLALVLQCLGAQCRSLYLNWIPLSGNIVQKTIALNPDLAQNLTHLTIGSFLNENIISYDSSIEITGEIVRLIGQNFISLTYLDIAGCGSNDPLNRLLPELASFHHLTELRFAAYELGPEHREHFETTISFPTVCTLQFFYNSYSKGHYTYKWLARIFPNVQNLLITCNDDDIAREWDGCLKQFGYLTQSIVCVWQRKNIKDEITLRTCKYVLKWFNKNGND